MEGLQETQGMEFGESHFRGAGAARPPDMRTT
jgi:hypothetical protein